MRPSATNLNRAGRGSSSGRVSASPGLSVQAPLNVNVGPNNLQGLAEILGVGTEIAMSDAARLRAQRMQEREEDERLASIAQAEADEWGNTVDPERIKTDRIYARRVATLSGTRKGLEMSEKLQADFQQWREDNPLAGEEDARQWIADWTNRALVDDEGNPIPELGDPAREAIIRQQLGAASFNLISKDRDVFRENVKQAGVTEAGGAFLSVVRQNRAVKPEDYQNLYTTLRGIGFTTEEANTQIAQWANAAAEALDSPEPIASVPDQWADGSAGPTSNPELLRLLDNQKDVYTARQQSAAIKALEPVRLQWRLQMEAKAEAGVDPTPEEMAQGLQIGMDDGTIASYFGKARATRERRKAEAEREARDAARHQETLQALEGSPWSVDQSKAEDAYTKEYRDAPDGAAKIEVVRSAIRNRGVLPGIYRNWINRIPNNPEALRGWTANMQLVRDEDAQVYASIREESRSFFEAYEALRASGRYNDTQAFERLQVLDESAGINLLKTDAAQELVQELVGEDATPLDLRNAERIIKTFGSFSDLPRSEALELARASFEKTYFRTEGVSYHRGFMRDPERVSWAREFFARELAKKGTRVDPDDLIITPVGNGSQFTVRERGGVAPLTPPFSADLLTRGYIQTEREDIRRRYGDEAFGAATQFLEGNQSLRPERQIPGETNRLQRMAREREAARELQALERSARN